MNFLEQETKKLSNVIQTQYHHIYEQTNFNFAFLQKEQN